MVTSAQVASTMRALIAPRKNAVTPMGERPKRQILVSAEALTQPGVRRPRPAETLLAVSKAVGSNLSLAEVLRATTRELARALVADVASVWRLEPDERRLSHVAGYRVPRQARVNDSSALAFTNLLTAAQRRSCAPIYNSDSVRDRRFDHPFLNVLNHRSVLIQPFRVGGQLGGVFVFAWTRVRHRLTAVELRLVDAIAQQAGLAIENAELLVSMQQFNEELERRVAERTAQLKLASDRLRASREELRALSLHLQRVREQEGARISREIHDELGQALTALKMDLSALIGRDRRASTPSAVQRAVSMVDDMITSVRRIATELRPQILDDLGLLAALEWQTQDFAARTRIRCRFRATGTNTRVDPERSTALFRMFQETLTNIARHAGATQVQVHLAIGRTAARLDVRDNGRGMRDARPRRMGLGVLGMRERAAAFGGDVAIQSAPRQGTHVRIRIPLTAAGAPQTGAPQTGARQTTASRTTRASQTTRASRTTRP